MKKPVESYGMQFQKNIEKDIAIATFGEHISSLFQKSSIDTGKTAHIERFNNWPECEVFQCLEKIMTQGYNAVSHKAAAQNTNLRRAAYRLAVERVVQAQPREANMAAVAV